MRKCLFALMVGLICFACDKEANNSGENGQHEVVIDNLEEFILGDWVYEYHRIQDDVEFHNWEELKFFASSAMYYSNRYDSIVGDQEMYFENENLNGTYRIDGNRLIIESKLGNSELYTRLNSVYNIEYINDLEFKTIVTSGKDTLGTFVYSKVVGEFEIGEEELMPDYQSILSGLSVVGYTSHNELIAKVDENTGAISGKSSGITYIDVVTNQGTAVIRVIVKKYLDYEYADMIGMNKDAVKTVMGKMYMASGNDMYYWFSSSPDVRAYTSFYNRVCGNWKTIAFIFNSNEVVEQIVLLPRDDMWCSEDEMIGFLSEHYYVYEKGTTETYNAFTNMPEFDVSTVGIVWDSEKRNLIYIAKHKRDYIEIGREEYTPNYEELVGDASVISFKSQNEYIAKVDPKTGVITGIDTGNTIIDVETSNGLISMMVSVKVFLVYDYDLLIGKNKSDVDNLFGVTYSRDGNDMLFKFNSSFFPIQQREVGNWDTMQLSLDTYYGPVTKVVLTAKDDVWFAVDDMTDFLSRNYIPSEGETSKEQNVFYSKDASVKVIWNINDRTLTFERYMDDKPFKDYGSFMGKTHEEVLSLMGEKSPTVNNEGKIGYSLETKYVRGVQFVFKNEQIGDLRSTVQKIVVTLQNDVDLDIVKHELDNNYVYDSNSGEYYTSDKKVRVMISGNTVFYLNLAADLDDSGLWPDYTVLIGKKDDVVIRTLGDCDKSVFDRSVMRTYWSYYTPEHHFTKTVVLIRGVGGTKFISVEIYLQDNVNENDVVLYLRKKYTFVEGGSDGNSGIYVFQNDTISVQYDVNQKMVKYEMRQ